MTVKFINRPDIKKKNQEKKYTRNELKDFFSKYPTLEAAESQTDLDVKERKTNRLIKDLFKAVFALGKGKAG